MKRTPLLFLSAVILSYHTSRAAVTDSSGDRHQIEFSVFGGVAQPFVDGQGGVKTRDVFCGTSLPTYETYGPGGAFGATIQYNVGLIKKLRLQLGIGYLAAGNKYRIQNTSAYPSDVTTEQYFGYINIPLHLSYSFPLPKGAITCRVGTSLQIGLHYLYHTKGYVTGIDNGTQQIEDNKHGALDNKSIKSNVHIGTDLKIGYAMSPTPKCSLNVGPVINFYHLANVYGYNRDIFGIRRYDFYAGVDLAFVFGVGKKK